ncbi:MAG TPA: ABC transporter transmembrane domain-containing protein, partial [Thermoanaerobaculia bacterium]|nr:ABC transporter transmembrane domain-containing protein [Thermoanaerobaculia bacterium]
MSSRRWWLRIARYARPQAGALGLLLALALLGAGVGLLTPWPLKLIVDHVLAARDLPGSVAWIERLPGAGASTGLLVWLAAATVALFLLRRTVKIAAQYVETGAGIRMVYDLATDLFHHLQRRSLLFHGRRRTGDLVKRVTADTRCVRELVLDVGLPIVTSVVTLTGMFGVMWSLDRRLALFALTLSVPMAVVARLFAKPMADRAFAQKELEGDLASLTEQTLTALPVVQAFGQERRGDASYRQLADRAIAASLRATGSQLRFNISAGTVNTLAT